MSRLLLIRRFFLKVHPSFYILLAILMLALFLRLLGTNPGYPLTHQDEPTITDLTKRIVLLNNYKPGGYWYGSLLPLLYAFIDKFFIIPFLSIFYAITNFSVFIEEGSVAFFKHAVSESRYFLYWARYETAILSAFTVVVVYLLGKKLFNRQVGLIAAFLTAVNYRHVLSSTFALSDAPSAFFAVLSVLLSVTLLKNNSKKSYIFAGIGLALALSVKYFIYILPTFLLCHIFSVFDLLKAPFIDKIKAIFFSKKFILAVFICITIFFIINPYLLLDFKNAQSQQGYNAARYGMTNPLLSIIGFFQGKVYYTPVPLYYLYQYVFGEILSFAIIFGYLYGLIRYTKQTIIISSAIVSFLFAFMVVSRIPPERNYASIIPFITFFPALMIIDFVKVIPVKRFSILLAFILTVILGFQSMENSFISSYSFSKPHNSALLVAWIKENIPVNSSIAATDDASLPSSWPFIGSRIIYGGEDEKYVTLRELKEAKIEWAVIASGSVAVNNALSWLNNEKIISLSFNRDLIANFLENRYLNLAMAELADYRVKEFAKPFWQSLDPAFIVVKIPKFTEPLEKKMIMRYTFETPLDQRALVTNYFIPCNLYKVNFSQEEELKSITSVEVLEKNDIGRNDCSLEAKVSLKAFLVTPGNWYLLKGKAKREYNSLFAKSKNGFFRLDFYSDGNKRIKTYVSKQLPALNKWDEFTASGMAPLEAKYAKTSFQLDNNINGEKYSFGDLEVFESDPPLINESEYPYYGRKIPQNFIWSLDL